MRTRILTTLGLALAVAACEGPYYGKAVPVAAQPPSLVCAAYGIPVGGTTYQTCVAYQESRAQAYPSQSVPPFRLDQYNNRIDAQGYRVDGTGRRMPVDSLYYRP
jgi:hypothetical protein